MSTYAVFGMERTRAVEIARKRVPTSKKDPNDPRKVVNLDVSEWEAAVQADADTTMSSPRVIQLSEKFDAPHYAEQFLDIAKRTGAVRLHVKAHAWTGDYDPETKKKVYKWVDVGSDAERALKHKVGFVA